MFPYQSHKRDSFVLSTVKQDPCVQKQSLSSSPRAPKALSLKMGKLSCHWNSAWNSHTLLLCLLLPPSLPPTNALPSLIHFIVLCVIAEPFLYLLSLFHIYEDSPSPSHQATFQSSWECPHSPHHRCDTNAAAHICCHPSALWPTDKNSLLLQKLVTTWLQFPQVAPPSVQRSLSSFCLFNAWIHTDGFISLLMRLSTQAVTWRVLRHVTQEVTCCFGSLLQLISQHIVPSTCCIGSHDTRFHNVRGCFMMKETWFWSLEDYNPEHYQNLMSSPS